MTVELDLTTSRPVSGLLLLARPYDHPHSQELVTALHADQLARYGYAESPHCDVAGFHPPDGLFLVAYAGRRAVGCGGFRPFGSGAAEVKRMYVRRGHRGRGIGFRILAALEDAAGRSGCVRIVLETGALNTSACALYRRFGYEPIPGYSADRDPEVNRAYARWL
ncbi:MAG: putative acetyltransferase [Actinomycetia bacterium]|jgi:GNAT superfamily N-acetyltransferase|nr:putative acetyltransferase [Actinomycetes bacterium]